MAKSAIIGGSGIENKEFLNEFKQEIVKTMYGNVLLFVKGKTVFLPRHGKNKTIPPHKINHKANICALNLLGVEKIFSLCSVGSLKESIKPGSIVVPNDYVDFSPDSFLEFEMKFITPSIDRGLIKEIKDASKKAKVNVRKTGVYVQSRGPRLETKAEVKIIKRWGDIVGMTMAKEAYLAQELGIPYASICSVDNYANGIKSKRLKSEDIQKRAEKNSKKLIRIINKVKEW